MTLFRLWDLPGDVLAAPESASGLDRCNLSLSLSLGDHPDPGSTLASQATLLAPDTHDCGYLEANFLSKRHRHKAIRRERIVTQLFQARGADPMYIQDVLPIQLLSRNPRATRALSPGKVSRL